MRHAAIALLMASVAAHAAAQQFDVASIKVNKADSNRVNLDLQPGGRFVASNVSLQVLIAAAYGDGPPLSPNRMVLNEKWIGGVAGGGYATADRFDIVAKADDTLTDGQFKSALRALLTDRFKLVVHHESRELPIYAMVMDRADRRLGPRLKRSDVDC